MEFGKRLRHIRISRNMTQAELAKAAGVSREAIGNYESGKRVDPALSTARNLSEALGVSLSFLMGNSPLEELPERDESLYPRFVISPLMVGEMQQTLLYEFDQLTVEEKREIIEIVRLKNRLRR